MRLEESPISFLRFELNPERVGPSGMAHFRELLPTLTAGALNYDPRHVGEGDEGGYAVDS